MAKSNFDLNKASKRRFDLSKDIDDDQPAAPAPTPTPKPEPTLEPEPRKSRTGLWIALIAAIAVVGALLWFCNREGGEPSGPEPDLDTTAVAATDSTIAVADTAQVDSPGVYTSAPAQEAAPSQEEATAQTTATQAAPVATTTSTAAPVSDDVDAEARNVIRGNYGVGMERKKLLGNRYAAIQARVNQLMAAY